MIPRRNPEPSEPRRRRHRIAGIGAVAAIVLAGLAGHASAHDGIASSDPRSGSELDDPIGEVLIDFGTTIGDDTEIVVFDPDDDLLDTETERVSETEAVVTFDPIDESGTYIVRYLASSIQDGHVLAGAISFSYDSGSSGLNLSAAMILYLAGAVVVVGIGAWLSYRRYRADRDDAPSDASEVDEDLSDIGV